MNGQNMTGVTTLMEKKKDFHGLQNSCQHKTLLSETGGADTNSIQFH